MELLELQKLIPEDLIQRINESKPYKDWDVDLIDTKKLGKLKEDLKRVNQEITIVDQQDDIVSTEQEEKNYQYWKEQKERKEADNSNIVYLQNQLKTIEENYLRAKESILQKLELATQSNQSKLSFFENRLQDAERKLEFKRSGKSRNKIRYLQKKEDLEKEIERMERPYVMKRQYVLCTDELEKIMKPYKSGLKVTTPVKEEVKPIEVKEKVEDSKFPPVIQNTKKQPKKTAKSVVVKSDEKEVESD
jgi:hypothetical protein